MTGTPPERELFLSAAEATDLLGIDPEDLARWERERALRGVVGAGGVRRYRRVDLDRLAREAPARADESETPEPEPEPEESARPEAEPQPRRRAVDPRRRALEILFAAEAQGIDPRDALRDDDPPQTRAIVLDGVEHGDEIDDAIRAAAERWAIERMPGVDRNVLRMGVYELLYRPDVAPSVTIGACVRLAKLLSTEESGRFVHGVLGRVARERRPDAGRA